MKILKSILIVLVVLLANVAVAKTGKLEETKTASIDVVIEKLKNGKILVGFEKNGTEPVKIKIYDNQGSTVYSERVKSKSLMLKRFDISQLPSGDYSYEVSSYDYTVEKVITK